MKTKSLGIASLVLVLILSACGPAPEPALSANDIANTAMADAWIMVTLTQAALPTATATVTPPPATPTWTPQPTFTFVPTSAPSTPTLTAAQNPCNQPPPPQPKGLMVDVQFINKSDGNVDILAFGMISANAEGECGTYNFSFGRFNSPVVKVLAGCYWAWASISGRNNSDAENLSPLCVTNASQLWEIQVGPEVIEFD
ncbi:MAG: hypothetical protein AB1649_03265 [Chloroflexota bacterium]